MVEGRRVYTDGKKQNRHPQGKNMI